MRKTVFIIGSLVLAAGQVFAQNLLVNPGFDDPDQLQGWTCTMTDGQATWSADDRLGSPDSGSMEHNVAATSNNQTMRCHQCVPVSELWTFAASARYLWPDDNDVSQLGTTRLSFDFFSDASCTAYISSGDVAVGQPILDTWLHLRSNEAAAPAGAMSAMMYVYTWQNLADEPVRARLDDLDFSTTTIFLDGFESGDTTAWSNTIP
jgi:hypothetical protein